MVQFLTQIQDYCRVCLSVVGQYFANVQEEELLVNIYTEWRMAHCNSYSFWPTRLWLIIFTSSLLHTPTLLLSIVDIQPPSCLGWEGVTGDCEYVSLTWTLLVLEVIFVQFISSGRCLSYIEIEDTFQYQSTFPFEMFCTRYCIIDLVLYSIDMHNCDCLLKQRT